MDYGTILFVGVAPEDRGGIASVLRAYRKHFTGSRFFTSNVSPAAFPVACVRFGLLLLSVREIRIVHIHGASRGSFYRKYVLFLIAKYLFRRKVIYHVHGGGFQDFYEQAGGFVQGRIRHFIDDADTVICLSDSWKRFFLLHFRPRYLMVLPNTVEQVATRRHREPVKVIFLFMGKIGERKGIYDLLKAAAMLLPQYDKQFEIWIGGDGSTQVLHVLAESMGLTETVFYKGWVTGHAKEELFGKATVFVLPSYHEGLPVSILEAMSHSLPVIATDVGGIPELVANGESGLLVKAGDKAALSAAMQQFILDRELAKQMGTVAADIIRKRFVFEHTRTTLDKLYTALNPNKNGGTA